MQRSVSFVEAVKALTIVLHRVGVQPGLNSVSWESRGTPDQSVDRMYSDTVNYYAYDREIRPNAMLVETPSKAQNSRLVSVTTTMNLCDSAAGISLWNSGARGAPIR